MFIFIITNIKIVFHFNNHLKVIKQGYKINTISRKNTKIIIIIAEYSYIAFKLFKYILNY